MICIVIVTIVLCVWYVLFFFFFFKQKTAYEMRISVWSSDVCSSDLIDAVALIMPVQDSCAHEVGYRAAHVRLPGCANPRPNFRIDFAFGVCGVLRQGSRRLHLLANTIGQSHPARVAAAHRDEGVKPPQI